MLWHHEGQNSGLTQGGEGGKEPEGGETPQKLPRSSQASEGSRRWLQQRSVQISINLAKTLQCLISVDTAFRCLATKNKDKTYNEDRSRYFPTIANLM